MGRTLNQVIASLPKERQKKVDERYKLMKDEIESLAQLRQLSGKAQADVAAALKIKQPSVSKIEKQTDMYLSTLQDYVKAVGGELDLVVKLPHHGRMRINRLGDVFSPQPVLTDKPTKRAGKRQKLA